MNKRILALALVLSIFLLLITGCGGKKEEGDGSGYEILSAEDQRLLLVTVSTENEEAAQVVVRKVLPAEEGKSYTVEREYTLTNSGGNEFAQVLEEEGIYQVEASCEGCASKAFVIIVEENRIYNVIISLTGLSEEATQPVSTEETTQPASTEETTQLTSEQESA